MKHYKFAIWGALLLSLFSACDSEEFVSAKMWITNGELDKAEEFFLKAIVVEPLNPEIPLLLAVQVYLPKQRWDEMNAMLDEALKRGPDVKSPNGMLISDQVVNAREFSWSEQYQKGAALYNDVINEMAGSSPNPEQKATLAQAIEHFLTAIQILPSDARAYQPLVFCYRQIGDTEGEQTAINSALQVNPDNGIILALAGQNARQESRLDDAIVYLEKASRQLPDDLNILQMLTGIYIDMDNTEAALVTLERSRKSAPRSANVFYNLGAVYSNIASAALSKGQDIYLAEINLDTQNRENIEEALSLFREAQEAFSEALYFMDNVLALNPDDSSAENSIKDISSLKKRLNTLQNAAEALLE